MTWAALERPFSCPVDKVDNLEIIGAIAPPMGRGNNTGVITMTKQFTFNTQRQYSPEGQIIKVIYDGDNTAHFMDTTRGLTGTVNFPHNSDQPNIVQDNIMTLYDLGEYEWLSEKDFQKKWEY